jgi:DNA-binding CsgD family transcriptional regulator
MACSWAASVWWRLRAPAQQGALLERELALQRQPARLRRQLQICLAHAHKDRGLAAEASADLRAREPHAEAWTAMALSWLDFREGNLDAAIKSMRAALGQIRPEVLEDTAMISELIVEASRHVDPGAAAAFIPEWQLGSHVPLWSVIAHSLRGIIAAELGDFEAVREHAQAARGRMTDDDWLGLGARVELVEAIAALSDRDHEMFQSKFDSAIATMRRVEHPWDESDAHYIVGKVLVHLGRPQEALPHFDEALAILARIEAARPFVDRVLAGRRETGAPDPNPQPARAGKAVSHGPRDLSEREIEVLRLLADGLSNRQIAAQLVISEPTVATHVRHILEKTRSAIRAEAAAFAVRSGLAGEPDHPI